MKTNNKNSLFRHKSSLFIHFRYSITFKHGSGFTNKPSQRLNFIDRINTPTKLYSNYSQIRNSSSSSIKSTRNTSKCGYAEQRIYLYCVQSVRGLCVNLYYKNFGQDQISLINKLNDFKISHLFLINFISAFIHWHECEN